MRSFFYSAVLFFLSGTSAFAALEQVVAVKDDQTLVLAQTGNARLAELVMPDAARAQGTANGLPLGDASVR